MSFQPRKHSGMQQLYHIGYTYGVNLLLTFLYHFCDLGKTYYRGSPTYKKIINTVFATTVLSLCTCKWGIFALVGDPLQSHSQKFHVSQFFPSTKICVRGPFVYLSFSSKLLDILIGHKKKQWHEGTVLEGYIYGVYGLLTFLYDYFTYFKSFIPLVAFAWKFWLE